VSEAVLPPEDERLTSPLARFGGDRPPAPDWFTRAVAVEPERATLDVAGANIELLTWGERGLPGLLFLHGSGAHADWWRFIAPFFAETHRCAAISWSGMGGSGRREAYTMDLFADEAFAAGEAAGLFEPAAKPVWVAHSFGGAPAMWAAAREGGRLGGVVVLDSGLRPPDRPFNGPPSSGAPHRVYPSLTAALARFRLTPAQTCDNLYLVDDIARRSLKQVAGPGEQGVEGEGWTWRFDPLLWRRMERIDGPRRAEALAAALCPMAFVWGERSRLMTPDMVAYTRSQAPPGSPFFAIPDAGHHVMLDQPLALVAALRGLFAVWPHTPD